MSKKQLVLFGAAIVIFLIASQVILKDQEQTLTRKDSEEPASPPPEDLPPQWEKAENEEAVASFYEEEIPMLQQAREENLTVTHDQSLPFSENREGEMTIVETWYNQEQIHILYKLDTESVDLEQPQTPRLMENAFVESLDSDRRDQDLYAYNQAGPAVLYDGEIYTYTSLSPITEEKELETPENSTLMRPLPAEEFDETVLASFHLHLGDGLWKTEKATLPLTYDPDSYNTDTYTFDDQEYFEQDGVRYRPLRIENDLRGLRLYVEIDSPRPLSNKIDAQLNVGNGEGRNVSSFQTLFETEEENVFVTRGAPLEDPPSTVTFTMNELYVKTKEEVSFEVDTRDFDDHVSSDNKSRSIEVGKTLGTYNGTELTLEKKRYEYPRNVTWEFTTDPSSTERPYLSHHPYRPVHNEYSGSPAPGLDVDGVPEDEQQETFLTSSREKLVIHSSQYALGDYMPVTFTLQNLSDALPFHAESSARR